MHYEYRLGTKDHSGHVRLKPGDTFSLPGGHYVAVKGSTQRPCVGCAFDGRGTLRPCLASPSCSTSDGSSIYERLIFLKLAKKVTP